ncbi:lysophospholipase [Aliifodinibius sp. S!AR15-10]|uniref:alpha/beta hydrolase n=1 Tax=Aliifodinibius sp. S!AR15-10 TaxID=2950437 RepID=UPI002861FF71|nr:alpha/beta fold hydrolase [Aliifodinibius sp. S!AR15-10]MDR8392037.1 lysophospholipase [Aliifodinibius sp. S!AR15-10]
MKKRAFRYSAFTLLLVSALFFGARSFLYYSLEAEAIATRPNDDTTPDHFGAPSQQFQFKNNGRTLYASLVRAEEADNSTPAVLLYHGRRETISRWAEVQALLYKNGITSMVFDYSGFGSSTGEPTIENLQDDGIRAWEYFTEHVATGSQPRIVLGHSLGTGILLSGIKQLQPKPNYVILSAPWSTARDAVIHLGMVPEEIYYLLPDVWNNVEAVRALDLPLLVVHGTEDRVVPPDMGRQVAEAGGGEYHVLEGVGHRELVRHPTMELWKPIIEAIYKVQN